MRQVIAQLPRKERAELAQRIGIVEPYLYQILHGFREPAPYLAVLIEQATDGRVSRKALRRDWAQLWPELA